MATDGWGVTEWKITSTRVFRDLFKHATYWQVERARHDAGVQMETWKQYGLRPTNMSHANGYPVSLPRWWLWQNSYEVQTAVAFSNFGFVSSSYSHGFILFSYHPISVVSHKLLAGLEKGKSYCLGDVITTNFSNWTM